MNSPDNVIRVGTIEVRFRVQAAQTVGGMTMFEFTVPARAKMPLPHYHERYDETIYGVEGVVTFTIEGKTVEVAPGQSCFIPRGAVHGFNNLTQTDVKALAVITPALLGPEFFKEAGAVVNAGGPPDIKKLNAIMSKHGLVAVMPSS